MDTGNNKSLRVGVIFGGRSGEHEVSLASARNVMEALHAAGHQVVPIGITPQGRWLPSGDPHKYLVDLAAGLHPALPERAGSSSTGSTSTGSTSTGSTSTGSAHIDSQEIDGAEAGEDGTWALLPRPAQGASLPALDILFPVLHGPFGEDGTLQGMLEMGNIPYVGCGVLASAVCMDKGIARQLFANAGIPQVATIEVFRHLWRARPAPILEQVEAAMGYPVFVKPANLGSSVGISKAHTREELIQALDLAARYDRKLLVEAGVPNAREIEVSVLGNDDPIASVPGEIIPGAEFYDYAAKYLDDTSEAVIPAPLDEETIQRIQELAVLAFRLADCSGLARVDFLLNGETGELFLNELNTMPGFTKISMYPKLWEASGIPYPELVDRLVQLGLERYADRQQNETTRE